MLQKEMRAKCGICGDVKFPSVWECKRHLDEQHSGIAYKCLLCDKILLRRMARHYNCRGTSDDLTYFHRFSGKRGAEAKHILEEFQREADKHVVDLRDGKRKSGEEDGPWKRRRTEPCLPGPRNRSLSSDSSSVGSLVSDIDLTLGEPMDDEVLRRREEEARKTEEKKKREEDRKREEKRKVEEEQKKAEERKREKRKVEEEQRKAEDRKREEKRKVEEEQRRAEERKREKRKVEEEQKKAEERKREEKRKVEEEQRKAEEKRKAEEERQVRRRREEERRRKVAEDAEREAELRRAEECLMRETAKEEKKKAEETRKMEEKMKAEEKKKAEENRRAEEKRKVEEKRAEEKKREEKKAEEERKAEEKRKAEERKTEEKKAEEERQTEEKRVEEKKKAEEERKAEEKRKVEEERNRDKTRKTEDKAQEELAEIIVERVSESADERVFLNIGGTTFETTRSTLGYERKSVFGMLIGENEEKKSNREFFFDRDPTVFRYVLNFLRNGGAVNVASLPRDLSLLTELLVECRYYNVWKLESVVQKRIQGLYDFL